MTANSTEVIERVDRALSDGQNPLRSEWQVMPSLEVLYLCNLKYLGAYVDLLLEKIAVSMCGEMKKTKPNDGYLFVNDVM